MSPPLADNDAQSSTLDSGNHEVALDPRVARIRAAMAPGVMGIVFQPVIDIRSGIVAGAEALARFTLEPKRTPDVWFNEAWDVDMGVELELIAIQSALASLERLPEGTHLAVNASPQTLISPLLDAVLDVVPCHRLIVELTEHAQVDDYANIKAAIARLRARGVRLAIDDAGAGFSSLQHILHLRPDLIKLDRSLTQGIDSDPVRYALAAALVTFALSLDAEICAEGIERDAELAALQHLGIAYGQGYFLGRPLPLPLAAPPKGVWLHEQVGAPREQSPQIRGARGGWSESLRAPSLPASLRPAAVRAEPLVTTLSLEVVHVEMGEAGETGADEAFDRISRWASALLRAPLALFSTIERDRQIFKSTVGLPAQFVAQHEARACESPCRHVVSTNGPVLISDTGRHPLAALYPALAQLGAGSYLGVPVHGASGKPVGVLAVMDRGSRDWGADDVRLLSELASALVTELELRAARRHAPELSLLWGRRA